MASVDPTRIAGNIQALNALNSLQMVNNRLSIHQTRLATGKRINEASIDPAGMSIATTFDIRRQGMKTALGAIGDAKNLLSTMEGGLTKIKDILVKMRNKTLESKSATIGAAEKEAIYDQLKAFRDEINDIVNETEWNGNALIGESGSASTSRNFLTNADGEVAKFQFNQVSTGSTGGNISDLQSFYSVTDAGSTAAVSSSSLGLSDYKLNVAAGSTAALSEARAQSALVSVENATTVVKQAISQVGAFTARLTFKEEALTVAHANTEAAYNRIMNANMAEEQVEASKLGILQQTAVAMLAQANVAPQFLLSLFR